MRRLKSFVLTFLILSFLVSWPVSATSTNPGAVISPTPETSVSSNPRNNTQSSPGDERVHAEFAKVLEKAKETKDLSDLSYLTSYIYVDKGFFGVEDPFPKIANAFVQAIFFLVKLIYVLTVIVLETVFKADIYGQIDSMVSFSGGVFEGFRDTWLLYMLMVVAITSTVSFIKKGKVPLSPFKFLGVMLLAMVMYSKSSLPVPGETGSSYQSQYVLSKVIRVIDNVTGELTTDMLASFDQLDMDNNFTSTDGQGLKQVKLKLFDEMIYQPFLHINYREVDKVVDDQVIDLMATRGDKDGVKRHSDQHPELKPALSFDLYGHKIMVALAALFKALVLGLAVIVLGLISLVFKYLTLIMIALSVVIFLIAMFPGLGYILQNAAKSTTQFTFIGGLGLVLVRGFLFLVTLIDKVISSMIDSYYWRSFLLGVVLYLLYRFRPLLLGIFTNGVIRAKELGDKVQSGLSDAHLLLSRGGQFSETFTNHRPVLDRTAEEETSYLDAINLDRAPEQPDLGRTLTKALGKSLADGKQKLGQSVESFYYGEGMTQEKAFARSERHRRKQAIEDKVGGFKDSVVSLLTLDKARATLHDYVGDTDTPVQQSYQERQHRQLQRQERHEAENERYQNFLQDSDDHSRSSYKRYREELFGQQQPSLPSQYGYRSLRLPSLDFTRDEEETDDKGVKPAVPEVTEPAETYIRIPRATKEIKDEPASIASSKSAPKEFEPSETTSSSLIQAQDWEATGPILYEKPIEEALRYESD